MKEWGECVKHIPIPAIPGGSTVDVPTLKCLEVIFENILTAATGLAILALFVMLLIGGFKYLTSAGNQKATASAEQTMTFAILGIALLVLAYLIFYLISKFTGVDLLHFTIPS